MLNAPDDALETIIELLPGLDSPTVLPLAADGMHAVHAVVPRDMVVDLLGPLRAAGARSILVLPIDNLIPCEHHPPRARRCRALPLAGGPANRTGRLHRFDMNTQPLPPSWYARAQARLSRVVVQTYPDATYRRLRSLLSEYTGHPAERSSPPPAPTRPSMCALS